MCYLSVIYVHSVDDEYFEESLGVYGFLEKPRIGETITIGGSGTYVIKKIEHIFLKKSKSEDIEFVNDIKIYVN